MIEMKNMRQLNHMKSFHSYQCLIPSINIRNIDRTENLGLGLRLELFGSVHIGIAESEPVFADYKTQNNIADKGIFIHTVAFLKSVSIQKDIPIHGMTDKINETVDSRALCACSLIGLFVKKHTALSARTKEKRPKILRKIRAEPELPSSGRCCHHRPQAASKMADQITPNFFHTS
jgi:hypothetical protein